MDASKSQHLFELFLLCEGKETGTLFLTNNVNHSCQVVLDKGEIISMAFGQLKGDEVLNSILVMKIVRFSFRKGLALPMPVEANINSSKSTLEALGYRKSGHLPPVEKAAKPKVKSTKPVIMYRGQVVESTEPEEVQAQEPVPASKIKSKKPLIMYRGQVVESTEPEEPEETQVPAPEVKRNKPLRMYRGQVVHG